MYTRKLYTIETNLFLIQTSDTESVISVCEEENLNVSRSILHMNNMLEVGVMVVSVNLVDKY